MKALVGMPWLWLILLLLACTAIVTLRLKTCPKWFGFLFMPFFVILSFLLYLMWGAVTPLQEKQMIDGMMAQIAELVADKQITRAQVVGELDQFVLKSQEAPFALASLASLYQQLGFFDKAMTVLARAIEISPQEEFQVQWIYNHALQNRGKLASEVRQYAKTLIDKENTNFVLLNLLAMDDFLQEEYESAIQAWDEILSDDQALTTSNRKVIEIAIEKSKLALANNKTKE